METAAPRSAHRRKAKASPSSGGADTSASLDAWGWAERISVIGLFTLAAGYALYPMQGIFVPVVTAWVMGAILRPIVDWAETKVVPRVVGVIATAMVALLGRRDRAVRPVLVD